MPLDDAQFIAEFSLTDPPGTDPVAEGDNHIRQVKIAVQQSFAFIDKAVLKTADQLNDVAQLSEANTFTEANSFAAATNFAALVTLNANQRFANDADRGLQWTDSAGAVFKWELLALQGSNDDIRLTRYVAGVSTDSPWSVSAATGVVDFAHTPTVQGAPIWVAGEIRQFAIAATPGANWFLADGTNGTKNLADRWLVGAGAFAGAVGTDLNAALDALTTANTTGATALTEAQMPAHDHRIWSGNQSGITDTTLGHAAVQTVVGANRSNSGPAYALNNAVGTKIIENAGSGSTHNHSSPAQDVVAQNPTFTGSVQPVSVAVATYQYVP